MDRCNEHAILAMCKQRTCERSLCSRAGREGRQGRASLTRWGLAAWKVLTEDLERRRDILCVLGLA